MKFTKKVTALAFMLAVTTFSVSAATGNVTADILNIRSNPSTESAVLGSEHNGASLTIKEYTNGWYKLDYNGAVAYASSDYVSINILAEGCMTYTDGPIYLLGAPEWGAQSYEQVPYGTRLNVTGLEGEFYEVLYYGNVRYIPVVCTDVRRDVLSDRMLEGTAGRRAALIAENYLGVPYVYGGRSPSGFDCSGFTGYVYSQLGVTLPRTSSSQASYGVAVEKTDLQPGDLLFFNTRGGGVSHVGLYVGNGSFIHAPMPGTSVSYANLHSAYWSKTYVCARRVTR